MSKRLVVDTEPWRRTDFHYDESDDKFTLNTVQDAQPIVDENKRKMNQYGDKLSVGKRGEWHHLQAYLSTSGINGCRILMVPLRKTLNFLLLILIIQTISISK